MEDKITNIIKEIILMASSGDAHQDDAAEEIVGVLNRNKKPFTKEILEAFTEYLSYNADDTWWLERHIEPFIDEYFEKNG